MIWQTFWLWVLKQIHKYRMKHGYRTPQQPYDCDRTITLELDMIIKILEIQGFDVNEFHPLQFIDEGQAVGARKILNEDRQLHVRMYKDKDWEQEGYDVHAHIEYTPERAPLRHLLGVGMINGCDLFEEIWKEKA